MYHCNFVALAQQNWRLVPIAHTFTTPSLAELQTLVLPEQPLNASQLTMVQYETSKGMPPGSPGVPPFMFLPKDSQPSREKALPAGAPGLLYTSALSNSGAVSRGTNLVWKIIFKTTSECVLWFLLKRWRKHILQWNCHHQDPGQESTIYVYIVTPRSLDSSSLLIIKSLSTAFAASEGTKSIIKMMFFRTANLSKTSSLIFKEFFKRGLLSKTGGLRILMHQTVSDLRGKKVYYLYLNRTSIRFAFQEYQINVQ